MSATLDANILVSASDRLAESHDRAEALIRRLAAGRDRAARSVRVVGGGLGCQNLAVPAADRPTSPLRISLSAERRSMLVDAIKRHFAAEFDEPLSDFRAEQLLDFFVAELGPPVYNQGVRDASSYIQEKLIDIEGEVFERDSPR
jgi:uncharacterized protein (DUF2164 family)